MIKRFIEFLLWPLAWLWHRHERQTLYTGIEGEDLGTDFSQLARAMKDQLDGLTQDAFTAGAYSTYTHTHDVPLNWDAIHRMLDEYEERRKDEIQMIVITRLAAPGSVLVCRYEGRRYALISREDWLKTKGSIVEQEPPYPMGFVPLVGIPVSEDEDLAARILMANLPAGQSNYRWN
jgi:hypothetical protein